MPLYLNADVWTLDPNHPRAQAILTDGEHITAVGSAEELRAHAIGTGAADVVDLGGATVIPGLVDAHLHAISYANSLAQVDLSATTSLAQAVAKIRAFADNLPDGVWVTGGRWDFNRWTDVNGQPDRMLLDAAVPDRPVAVWSIDMHTLWCNGAALAAAGIADDTPDPRGGRIVRDGAGIATGVLKEDAATLVERQLPTAPRELLADRMAAAQDLWLSEGLTGIHDIDGEASREAWLDLGASERQRMRVVKYLRLEEMAWAESAGWRTGDGDAWFHHGGLKLFSDGALGSQSAHMSSPYPQEQDAAGVGGAGGTGPVRAPLNFGMQIATQDVLVGQIEQAYWRGMAVAVHAIGDAANHQVLDALEACEPARLAAKNRTGRILRPRVEHAQFVQPADIARFARLGTVASMQPRHCISDIHLLRSLHPDESLAAYAWTDMAAAGAHLAFGSDGPVEPSNPFAAIYAAMTRADISGDPSTTFQRERRMGAYAAIAAHATGPAYAAARETATGRLAPGYEADFIAVNTSPFAADGLSTEWADGAGYAGEPGLRGTYASDDALFAHATAIRDTRVQTTVVGGQVVFSR